MILIGWNVDKSNREFIEFKKGDFSIHVLTDSEDSFNLSTEVFYKDTKVDKFFNDFSTALIWCEGRM